MLDWLGRAWKRTKVWEWHGKSFQRRKNLALCYGGWQQYNNTWGGCWRAATDPGLREAKTYDNVCVCVQLYWIPVWLAMVVWGIWAFNCLKSARFERPRVCLSLCLSASSIFRYIRRDILMCPQLGSLKWSRYCHISEFLDLSIFSSYPGTGTINDPFFGVTDTKMINIL